jgi:hypothetical protein
MSRDFPPSKVTFSRLIYGLALNDPATFLENKVNGALKH